MNTLDAANAIADAQTLEDTVNALNAIRSDPGNHTLAQAAAALSAALAAHDAAVSSFGALIADSQDQATTQLP
jgi:hypothetical protein